MVSARKVKARLDKKKLAELKKKNADKQAELALSAEEAQSISDDLVKSAISGFEKELQKSSPAMKQLAANLSGMIQEFFIGFKQGVDAELNTFIKDTSKTLSTAVGDMNVAVTENVERLPEALKESLEDLKKEKTEAIPSLPSSQKPDSYKSETKEKEQRIEMIVSDVLKRPTTPEAAKTVLGKTGNVKDWLTRAGFGALGMEETAEKIIEQRQQREAFVKTESKLRAKEFEGKSPEETRKILEDQFKVISETTEKLREIEKEISSYKELGYSEQQIKQLGVGVEKEKLTEQLIAVDPSRMEKYTEKTTDTNTRTTERIGGSDTSVKESSTELGYTKEQITQIISDLQQTTESIKTAGSTLEEKTKETAEFSVKDQVEKTTSSSVLEETITEQSRLDEQAAKQRDEQTTLLSEIREILRGQKAATEKAAAQGTSPQGEPSVPMPNIDIDLPRRGPSPRGSPRGSILKSAGRSAMNIARVAGPAALAGAAVLGGVNLVDTGLGKLGAGKDAEGKDLEIDETQDDENWQKMSTGGKIMSGAARGIEKVGSFLGLDNLSRAARADRIKSETEYLKNKEATIQNTKQEKTEILQQQVESKQVLHQTNVTTQGSTLNLSQNQEMVQVPNSNVPQEQSQNLNSVIANIPNIAAQDSVSYGARDSGYVPVLDSEVVNNTEPQQFKLERLETGEFTPVPMSIETADQQFNTNASSSDRRQKRNRPASVPFDDGGILAAESRKARRKLDSVVSDATRNLPPSMRAEMRTRTEKLGGIFNPREAARIFDPETNLSIPVSSTITNNNSSVDRISVLDAPEKTIPRFEAKNRMLPSSVSRPVKDPAIETAEAIAKNIVIQAPAPVVVPSAGGASQPVMPPFTTGLRNNEPSISDYLRSRYV